MFFHLGRDASTSCISAEQSVYASYRGYQAGDFVHCGFGVEFTNRCFVTTMQLQRHMFIVTSSLVICNVKPTNT